MIGVHKATLYPEPAALSWVSLATNYGFDASGTGWRGTPWSTSWTWVSGGFMRADNPNAYVQGLDRDPAYPIARPANAAEYRVRVGFTLAGPSRAFWSVYGGSTAQAAYDPAAPGVHESLQAWTWQALGAGSYVLEAVRADTFSSAIQFVAPHFHVDPTPAGAVTVDFLDLSYRTGAGATDLSCYVDDIAIAHGREDTTAQPEASSCTLNLTASPEMPLPAALDVGAVITVATTLPAASGNPAAESVRFSGRVTDVHMGWDEAGEETPDRGIVQVVAVGPLADLGRRVVGAEPFPQELDGARVARVLTLAGYTMDPTVSDPGTVQILPRDIDSRAALEVAADTAQSAGGIVWQTRDGSVRYADADHRRGTRATLTLDACDILVTPSWVRNMDGLINAVSLGYGTPPPDNEDGEQPRYLASRPDSQTKWGVFAYSTATELAALADATAMANLLLTRNSRPAWVLSTVPVDVAGLNQSDTAELLRLDMHALINLTGLPAIGKAPTSLPAWIEGYRETLANGVHDIELIVSDYCRTSPPPRWNDLPPEATWDNIGPLSWDDAACLGPPVNLGRWDDVAASLRWDQIAPAITWDTWK